MMKLFSTKKEVPEPFPEKAQFFRQVDIEFLIHELKDPIAVIETGLRALLDHGDKFGPLTKRQRTTLGRSLRNAAKARDMLGHLLEIGRSQEGCFVCCRFDAAQAAYDAMLAAVEACAWTLAEETADIADPADVLAVLARNGIGWHVDQQVQGLEILQDRTKFCQISGNLIKNALHHRRSQVNISIGRQEDNLVVEVADDGPGVEPGSHQVIFERYSRGKACDLSSRPGHGLGLAGARIMARCLGGEIVISSQKGQGAVFRLTLPLTIAAEGLVKVQMEEQTG
jgi:signal transduction histidine kinase